LNCVCGLVADASEAASAPYTEMKDGNWELACTPDPASDGIFMYALPPVSFVVVVVCVVTSSTRSRRAHRFSEFEPVAISEEVVFVVSEEKGLLRDRWLAS
jgi:hypothetical protein